MAAAALLPQVRFDLNPLHLKDPTTESVQTAFDLLAAGEATPQTISVLADDREEAAALAERLEKLDAVADVVWLADLRSAERRVGKGGVGTCISRWSPDH